MTLQTEKYGALVTLQHHPEDDDVSDAWLERFRGIFSRLDSPNDPEAHAALDKIRPLLKDIGIGFSDILRHAGEASDYQEQLDQAIVVNGALGEQNQSLLRENARLRIENDRYRLRRMFLRAGENILRNYTKPLLYTTPLLAPWIAYKYGYVNFSQASVAGAALAVLTAFGSMLSGSAQRSNTFIGIAYLFAFASNMILNSQAQSANDAALNNATTATIDTMQGSNNFGPVIIHTDYPFDNQSAITSIIGERYQFTYSYTLNGASFSKPTFCTQYWTSEIDVPKHSTPQQPPLPDKRSAPYKTFGSCVLFNQLKS